MKTRRTGKVHFQQSAKIHSPNHLELFYVH